MLSHYSYASMRTMTVRKEAKIASYVKFSKICYGRAQSQRVTALIEVLSYIRSNIESYASYGLYA